MTHCIQITLIFLLQNGMQESRRMIITETQKTALLSIRMDIGMMTHVISTGMTHFKNMTHS